MCSILSHNNLTGTIPNNLNGLTTLYLDNNQLESPFPDFLQQQPNIRYVNLQNNHFVRSTLRACGDATLLSE